MIRGNGQWSIFDFNSVLRTTPDKFDPRGKTIDRIRKASALFLFILMFLNNVFAQSSSNFKLIKSISIEAKDIQTDRLGNLYLVTKTNQLYKYNPGGELLSTLNYKYLGNITHVDASNPLEVYVFYKEINKIIFLDNNLSYRGEVDLNDFTVSLATAVARSYDNGIWVFDASDLQLKRFSKTGELLQQSGNIKQFVKGNASPNYIYDNGERVFVNDSAIGIMEFNVFAAYSRTIHVKGCDEFKMIGNDLFYNKDKKLVRYDLKTFSESEFALPETNLIQNVSIEKNRLYLLKPGEVSIYSY